MLLYFHMAVKDLPPLHPRAEVHNMLSLLHQAVPQDIY